MRYIFIVFLFLSFSSYGNPHKNFLSPFQLASGGAGVASVKSDFSYIVNPAILGFYSRSQIGGAYYKTEDQLKKTIISIVDTGSLIPMGITYEREFDKELKTATKERWETSVGYMFQRFLSLGVTIQREKEATSEAYIWEVKAGGILKLRPHFKVGIVFENLKSYAQSSQNKPHMIIGAHYNWSHFLNVRADLNYKNLETWSLAAGTETVIKKFIALRVGGHWIPSSLERKTDDLFISFGAGLKSPKLQFDLAYSTPSLTKQGSLVDIKDYVLTVSLLF